MAEIKVVDPNEAYKAEVIDCLERLLASAHEGKILSVTYVCERPGNEVTCGGTRTKDRYLMLGFLSHMMFLFHRNLDDEAVPTTLFDDEA